MSDLSIKDVVHFEARPGHYTGVWPFTATIHFIACHPISIQERAVIQDAIVAAACKIRHMRGLQDERENFELVDGWFFRRDDGEETAQ